MFYLAPAVTIESNMTAQATVINPELKLKKKSGNI